MKNLVNLVFSACAIVFLIGGLGTPVHAQGWFGATEEPLLMQADVSLSNPESIRITINVNGKEQSLSSWEALVFLSVRHYVQYDDAKGCYVFTGKYQHWKDNINTYATKGQPTVPGPPSVLRISEPIVGTWRWDQLNGVYDARWDNGAHAKVSVGAFGPSGITMTRTDMEGPSKGLQATYIGQLTGPRSAAGTVTWLWNGTHHGTWTATW